MSLEVDQKPRSGYNKKDMDDDGKESDRPYTPPLPERRSPQAVPLKPDTRLTTFVRRAAGAFGLTFLLGSAALSQNPSNSETVAAQIPSPISTPGSRPLDTAPQVTATPFLPTAAVKPPDNLEVSQATSFSKAIGPDDKKLSTIAQNDFVRRVGQYQQEKYAQAQATGQSIRSANLGVSNTTSNRDKDNLGN